VLDVADPAGPGPDLGALVRISVRRIKIAMASACPVAQDWTRAAVRLTAAAAARASPA